MTIAIKTGVKMPKAARKPSRPWFVPTDKETEAFDAFISEYRMTHSCGLRKGYFDGKTREMQFYGPQVNEVLTAKRCKERIRQLRFRRGK